MNVFQVFHRFLTSPLHIGGFTLFFSPLQVLLRLVLPILVLLIIYRILLLLLRRVILKPLKMEEPTKKTIYRYVRLVLRIAAFLLLFFIIAGFFAAKIPNYIAGIWQVLTSPLITAGNTSISIITFILAIPVFYLASWLARLIKRFVDATILNQMSIDEANRFTISSLIRYGAMILMVLIGLSLIGINLSSLAVLFGVLGIGVGFGLQNVVANFFSGLVIIFERPIKEGDRILVNGLEGDVIHIRLRSTIINTLTNETIIVPNSQLVGNSVHNYSYQDRRIIIVSNVQVSYGTDLDRAAEVLLGVAAGNPYALKQPLPSVKVMAFQDSGILIQLWTWIRDATQKLAAASWTNLEIWRCFKREGIVIPFPQLDLHVKEAVANSSRLPPETKASGASDTRPGFPPSPG